jgi:hypothetical protein
MVMAPWDAILLDCYMVCDEFLSQVGPQICKTLAGFGGANIPSPDTYQGMP